MSTVAVVPVRHLRLHQCRLVLLTTFGALVPIACSDREPSQNVVPRAGASTAAKERSITSEVQPPQPRLWEPGWILVQWRSHAALPAPARYADGSSDVLVTELASIEPSPWRELAVTRGLAIGVPTALPLHGIDLVLQTCEVQVDLGAVSRVDVLVVRDPQQIAHGHGGRPGASLRVAPPHP